MPQVSPATCNAFISADHTTQSMRLQPPENYLWALAICSYYYIVTFLPKSNGQIARSIDHIEGT